LGEREARGGGVTPGSLNTNEGSSVLKPTKGDKIKIRWQAKVRESPTLSDLRKLCQEISIILGGDFRFFKKRIEGKTKQTKRMGELLTPFRRCLAQQHEEGIYRRRKIKKGVREKGSSKAFNCKNRVSEKQSQKDMLAIHGKKDF